MPNCAIVQARVGKTLPSNVALAMLPVDLTRIGTDLEVALPKRYSNFSTVQASAHFEAT